MKRETQRVLNLGLELPAAERAKLAQELLRSIGVDRPAVAGEVAETASAYGEFSSEPRHTILGSFPPKGRWGGYDEPAGLAANFEEADVRPVELEEAYAELRRRSQAEMVANAVREAEAALAALGGAPKVVRLEVALGHDPFGKPRANVDVVLKDLARGRLYSWDRLQPIHDVIWEAFNEKAAGGPWPYIKFHQESEPCLLDDRESVAA